MYGQSYFPAFYHSTLEYVNKTFDFANNLYFGHNERRFHFEFYSRVKFRSKFTRFRIDISFRIECSIRNEKWNELDPEGVATQGGFRKTNIIQSPMISTETKRVLFGLNLNPDSCKHPLKIDHFQWFCFLRAPFIPLAETRFVMGLYIFVVFCTA